MSDLATLLAKTVARGDCRIWQGSVGQREQPTTHYRGRQGSARRVIWELSRGAPPPKTQHITVTCGERLCLNPEHLALRPFRDIEGRFWAKVQKTDGCWLWTGAKFRNGYGAFRMSGQIRHAARVSYELHNGPIEGHVPGDAEREIVVMHLCDNPPCVRPDHLKLGTDKTNIADMIAKGRAGFQKRRAS